MRLIDAVKFWDNLNDEFEMGVTDAIEAVNNALDNTPVVDVEPVRYGHWEKIPGSFSDHRRCSNCHYDPPDDGGTWESADSNECAVSEFTFCPHCGAKMGEEG